MSHPAVSRILLSGFTALTKRDSSCTGSSQECEKPASSSYKKAIILGVLIPVAVIVILFSSIFIHLKHKSRKEKLELEEDPQFDGNLEFYEYDTPQIARSFNEVNNSMLVGKENSLDYAQEAEYEAKQHPQSFEERSYRNGNYQNGNYQNRGSYNPFE